MLIYFHQNRAKYEKGQLAPFFILVLVLLIIMALVTVNLNKVAFIKTDSSNAADAGALAAGSVMANTFNALAIANSYLEVGYQEFMVSVSVSFTIALVALAMAAVTASTALTTATSALASACSMPCSAMGSAMAANTSITTALGALASFIRSNMGIMVSVTAFQLAQHYFYLQMRRTGQRGRESAVNLGQKFAFINSGIGAKLKEGEQRNNFSQFLDTLEHNAENIYDWQDGQNRGHFVRVNVGIDMVDEFELKVALMPLAVELATLGSALILAYSAKAELTAAGGFYLTAFGFLVAACVCQLLFFVYTAICALCAIGCGGCCKFCGLAVIALACWKANCAAASASLGSGIAANTTAITTMITIAPVMALALAGLAPGPVIDSGSDEDALPFIICWIEDIDHNRLVTVNTTQHHEGTDLGLWQTRYPDTTSRSVVDFSGEGRIHPPELKYDASIVETN